MNIKVFWDNERQGIYEDFWKKFQTIFDPKDIEIKFNLNMTECTKGYQDYEYDVITKLTTFIDHSVCTMCNRFQIAQDIKDLKSKVSFSVCKRSYSKYSKENRVN